jgi:hypothetical protein
MSLNRAIALVMTGAASLLVGSSTALAEPLQQAAGCPVATDEVVTQALGVPARLFDPQFGVTVNGAETECMFSAGGHLVLVRRTSDYFSGDQSAATPENVEQLRQMVTDDLDYVPVPGVGDAALWATVRDRSLANARMGVLVSKQGTDAYTIGVMETPEALATATALTQAVVAAQHP